MEIVGHQKQQQFLKTIVESNNIPHALLFSGQNKLGKKTVALGLISSLFKEKLSNHPDFILIEPKVRPSKSERSSVQGKIQISQIRDLSWRLSLKPIRAPLFGVIIDKAHLMTKEAQNCFLKTLEEPKSRTLLILTTEHPNFLLPTILSRCEMIRFYPVKREEIRDYLKEKGVSKERIEKIVNISLGRPGIAIELVESPEKLKERDERIKELVKISKSPLHLRFQQAQKLSKSQNLKEVLKIWLSYFRDKAISQGSQIYEPKVRNIIDRIEDTIFLTSTTNVNPRLALEILMLEL